MAALAAAFDHVVIDVGAGDGGYVLDRARTEPRTFAIAIDASPDGLTAGAWRAKRSRLVNAAFLVEGIERIPVELSGLADEATVHFPWGSLLQGLLDGESQVLAPLAGLLTHGGELRVLLSATARDGFTDITPENLIMLGPVYADNGLHLIRARWASPADLVASRSTWAKRLGVGRARAAVLARYRRRDPMVP